jgi:hypothetical protein
MHHYFYLLAAEDFHGRIKPALTESWRRHHFAPCRDLCAELIPRAHEFRESCASSDEEPLLCEIARGAAFDRTLWKLLAGELLMYSAADIPLLESSYDALRRLLGDSSSIREVHFGSRDLQFGSGFYRPEHAGYNDSADVARLADYLGGINPQQWVPVALAGLPGCADTEGQAEELELVRDWFPPLRALYRGAADKSQIIVCESL